jgi:MFS family permease
MTITTRGRSLLPAAQSFWLVGYVIFVLFLGTTIPTPLYRVYQEQLGFSSGTLTLIFAIYVASLIPSLLLFGQLSDRIGRRPVILLGLVIAAVAAAIFATAHSLASLFLARCLQGIATGITASAATAALSELEPDGNTKRAAFVTSASNAAGGAIGPLLAGVIGEYGASPTVTPYLIYLGLMIPLIALVRIPETVAPGPFALTLRKPQVPRHIRKEFALASAVSFAVWATAALYLTLAPSYVAALLDIHSLAVSGAVVFLMVGTSAVAQTLGQRLDLRSAMIAGLCLLPIGLAGVILAVPLHAILVLIVATFLVGSAHGLGFMGSLALLNKIAPADRRAEVASSFYVISYLGVALAAVGIGFGAQLAGLFQAVVTLGLIVSALALVLLAQLRRL